MFGYTSDKILACSVKYNVKFYLHLSHCFHIADKDQDTLNIAVVLYLDVNQKCICQYANSKVYVKKAFSVKPF